MSHMNKSCRIWMSHVTCEWVMSHDTSHVTYLHVWWMRPIWVMSHMNESSRIRVSHVKYECVMSHDTSHVTVTHLHVRWMRPILMELYGNWISNNLDKSSLWCQHFQFLGFLKDSPQRLWAYLDRHTGVLTLKKSFSVYSFTLLWTKFVATKRCDLTGRTSLGKHVRSSMDIFLFMVSIQLRTIRTGLNHVTYSVPQSALFFFSFFSFNFHDQGACSRTLWI